MQPNIAGFKFLVLLFCFFIFVDSSAIAQEADSRQGVSVKWPGKNVELSIQQILDQQAYMEKHNLLPKHNYRKVESNEKELLRHKFNNPLSPKIASYKAPDFEAAKEQAIAGSYNIALSFDAVKHSDITQGWMPPDPMLDCGPKQLILVVNGRIRVFDKTGVMLFDIDADVFFNSVRGGSNAVDPRVRYDVTSKRWFISSITIESANNHVLLAVSSGPILNQQTTFKLMEFKQNLPGTASAGDNNQFADYETLGVDANAVYIGCNMFNSTPHTSVWVINKADMINGILTVTAFRNIGNATSGGPYTPQGVSNSDPGAREGYFIGTDYKTAGLLSIRRISFTAAGVASISGNISVTVPSTGFPLTVPNKNGGGLPAIDGRLLLATMHKNDQTGKYSLWCSHSSAVNSSGIGTGTGDRNGVRWYEIGNLQSTPNLRQAGTLFDSAITSAPNYYWMGTICMNGAGNALISCSVSSKNIGGNGAVAVHYANGGGGTTSAPSATTNNLTGYFGGRWGDYSSASVDPSDNSTFWGCHEYVMNGDYVVKVVKVTVTNGPQTSADNALPSVQTAKWLVDLAPNPAFNSLRINLSNPVNERLLVSITNLYGIRYSGRILEAGIPSWTEDISALKPGFYTISISSQDGSYKQALQFEKR